MPLKGSAATESANDTGRRGNSETATASLSIFDGGRDSRGGTPQAHRRYQECLDQRVLLSGTFSREACHAGVLILEAVAQTGGLLLLLDVPDRENKLLYFVAVDGARFRRPVVPGDQLRIEVNVLNWRGDFCKLEGKATVNGQLAAEGTVMCKMIDREPPGKTEEPAK